MNMLQVAQGALFGLLLGGGVTLGKQLLNQQMKRKTPLDPPCENMEILSPEMADAFRHFMGPFYRMCDDDRKRFYKVDVQLAMEQAEAVMVIEMQVLRGEVVGTVRERCVSMAHADKCITILRKNVRQYFDTALLHEVCEKIDQLSILMTIQLQNIRNTTS
ncbi:Hypothetical protein UVM_LOCUS368 [uncultured virus]|nr:Hypothetical protein UVM_LOCUS368 [uncultured virus]